VKPLVDPSLEAYAVAQSTPVPQLMHELRDYTHAHMDLPQMQVGEMEGTFLKVMARAIGARRILEVGTFTGYSTLMMASALPGDGELITCELEAKHAEVAQKFFDKSPHGNKIRLMLGSAAETIAALKGPFDMAFIDADKGGYISYFDLILPRMRKGGLIVCDNVLWSGRVIADEDDDDSTEHIRAFNDHIRRQQDLDKVMVTVRDGMTLIVA